MKKETITKFTGMVLAASMLMGLAGCDSLKKSSFDESEVETVMEDYIKMLKKGKYSKAADLIKDGSDYYTDADLSGFQMDILDALFSATTYKINDIEGETGKSAKCTLELKIPDLDDVKDGLDFLDDIADADTFKEEYTIKFVYDDDEWFIKDASDIADTYLDPLDAYVPESATVVEVSSDVGVEDFDTDYEPVVSSGDFDIDEANALMQEKMNSILFMDSESLYELALDSGENLTYEEFEEEYGIILDFMIAIIQHTSFSYDLDITDNESYAFYTIEAISEEIDVNEYNNIVFNEDSDAFAQLIADSFFGDLDETEIYKFYVEEMIKTLENQSKHNYNTFVVSIYISVEDDEYIVDGFDFLMDELTPDLDAFELDDIDSHPDFMEKVYTAAYESGYIDKATRDELIDDSTVSTSNEAGTIVIEEGSDFKKIEFYSDSLYTTRVDGYVAGDNGVHLLIYTLTEYMAEDEFSVIVYENGKVVFDGVGFMGSDNNDSSVIDLGGTLAAGEYVMVITGFDGEEFATVHFYT